MGALEEDPALVERPRRAAPLEEPRDEGVEDRGRESARGEGPAARVAADDRPRPLLADLDRLGPLRDRADEERAGETSERVLRAGVGRRLHGAARMERLGRRGGTGLRRGGGRGRSRLPAVEEVLEDRLGRDEEPHVAAGRGDEAGLQDRVPGIHHGDEEDAAAPVEGERPQPSARVGGEGRDRPGRGGQQALAGDAREAGDAGQRVEERLLADGPGLEEGPVERASVGAPPVRRAPKAAEGDVPRLRKDLSQAPRHERSSV